MSENQTPNQPDDFVEEINTPKPTKVEQPSEQVKKREQDVKFDAAPFSQKPEGDPERETLAFPSASSSDVQEAIRKMPWQISSPNYSPDQQTREWLSTLNDAAQLYPVDDVFEEALNREGSSWRQAVEHNGTKLAGSYPKFKMNPSVEVSGEKATARLKAYRGLGSMYRLPLWNSGFWITFSAPSEPELIELNHLIASDRAQLGRRSYGMSFSNTTGIYADRILAFAMEHIYTTSVRLKPDTDIRTLIKCTDLPAIAMAIAATKWPSGFDYERACTCDPENCKHVVKERVDITKLLMVDTNNLTQWQLAHMSKVSADSMEEDDVRRYQEEMVIAQSSKYVLDKDSATPVSIEFKVPNCRQYVEAAHRWIADITAMVDRALTKDTDNNQRNAYLVKQGQATSLRMYAHWVKSLSYFDVNATEHDTLEQNIDAISGDDVLRADFLKFIHEYIAGSTATVIGIPTYTCPNCKGTNTAADSHPTIQNAIPIDVYQTFFELIAQKIRRISER